MKIDDNRRWLPGERNNLNINISYFNRETEDAEQEVQDFLLDRGLFVAKLNWNTITPKLAGIVSIICNIPSEKIFSSGMPDFFVASGILNLKFNPALIEKDIGVNIDYTFIEVKKETDGLAANQLDWMVKHQGLKIELWYLYKNIPT